MSIIWHFARFPHDHQSLHRFVHPFTSVLPQFANLYALVNKVEKPINQSVVGVGNEGECVSGGSPVGVLSKRIKDTVNRTATIYLTKRG